MIPATSGGRIASERDGMPREHVALPLPAIRWLTPLIVLLALAVAAVAAAAVWAGSAQTWSAITSIGLLAFVAGTLVASTSYAFRFARWQWLLWLLGHRLPAGFSARVYLGGLALSPTPGKVGETMRSALLLPHGVPLGDSLAAFFADRLSDVIGVAALAALVAAAGGSRQPVFETVAALTFATALAAAALLRGGRLQPLRFRWRQAARGRPWLAALAAPARAWAGLWSAPRSVLFAAVAAAAFGIQGLVFGAFVQAVAPQIGLLTCVAIFSSATLIGAASMIPGGLGAMEAALAWQLTERGVAWPQALAAVVATRAATLWCGTALGALMLASLASSAAPAADERAS